MTGGLGSGAQRPGHIAVARVRIGPLGARARAPVIHWFLCGCCRRLRLGGLFTLTFSQEEAVESSRLVSTTKNMRLAPFTHIPQQDILFDCCSCDSSKQVGICSMSNDLASLLRIDLILPCAAAGGCVRTIKFLDWPANTLARGIRLSSPKISKSLSYCPLHTLRTAFFLPQLFSPVGLGELLAKV